MPARKWMWRAWRAFRITSAQPTGYKRATGYKMLPFIFLQPKLNILRSLNRPAGIGCGALRARSGLHQRNRPDTVEPPNYRSQISVGHSLISDVLAYRIVQCMNLNLHTASHVLRITKTSFLHFYEFVRRPAWRCLCRSTMQRYRGGVNLKNANVAGDWSNDIYILFFFVTNIDFLFMFGSQTA